MKKISFGFIAICIFCFNANAQNTPKKDNGGITPEKLESWVPVPVITPGNTNADPHRMRLFYLMARIYLLFKKKMVVQPNGDWIQKERLLMLKEQVI